MTSTTSTADPAATNQTADILGELKRYESRKASIDELFERWAFALSGVLLVVKVVLTITHTVSPFEHGLPAILFIGAAIIGTAALGQLPTLYRLVRQAIVPGRNDATRDAQLADKLKLLEVLETYPATELAKTKFLIVSQGSNTASRLDFLVGPVSRLGIVPAIVMLLTSFARLGSTVTDGGPATLDAVHYATVLTFVLYFAAAIADSLNRRVAFYGDVLRQAGDANTDLH